MTARLPADPSEGPVLYNGMRYSDDPVVWRTLAAKWSRGDASVIRTVAPLTPPSCNTGGTHPTPLPDNLSKTAPQGQKTIIDTISWTIPDQQVPSEAVADGDDAAVPPMFVQVLAAIGAPGVVSANVKSPGVKPILARVLAFFPGGCEWAPVGPGKHGYPFQTQLVSNSLVLGWLAFGADHGKHWLYLTGTGLRHRREGGFSDETLADLGDVPGARLGRVDIALDLFDHETFSVEASILAHATGGYELDNSPGKPHSELFQSDTKCEDYAIARTHYIGKRNATKRMRVYDKGLQMLGSLTAEELDEYKAKGIVRADPTPEGSRLEEWTRVELIYKHDKKRPIDHAMILDRDRQFAGAYPILAGLLGRSDGVRPAYVPLDEDCELAKLIEAGRDSYGGLIYFLRNERGFDDARIISELIGTKSSARLMVDKERPSVD